MYGDKLREFHVKNYVLKEVLKKVLPPRLWVHLTKKLGLNFEMITTQWIMTMFAGYINDPAYILPILDNFIIEGADTNEVQKGWRYLYSSIAALMCHHAPQLLEMTDIGQVARHFQNMQSS